MAKRSVLDNPGNQQAAVGMLAVGVSQAKVARCFGVGRSSVSRWKSRADIEEMLKGQMSRLAAAVPDAVDFQRNMVRAGKQESGRLLRKNPKPPDYKLIEAAGRSSENVLKATGLLPTATTSQTFNTLLISDQTILSPVLARLIAGDELDVTPEDEENQRDDDKKRRRIPADKVRQSVMGGFYQQVSPVPPGQVGCAMCGKVNFTVHRRGEVCPVCKVRQRAAGAGRGPSPALGSPPSPKVGVGRE